MLAQSGTALLIEMGSWFILAAILLRDEFGIVSLAFATRIFTDVLKRTGLRQVLVQRQQKFNRWATPGFWLSLSIGFLATAVMSLAAPIVAKMYDQPDLLWMVLILATVPSIGGLTTVPMARMQSDLRFRGIAVIEFSWHVGLLVMRVLLALAGLGPFACVIPEPIGEAARSAAYWWLAKPRIHRRLRLRRWRYLIADSWWLLLGSMALKFVAQAPYFIGGFFLVPAVLGDYFFAFMFSIRVVRLFMMNLENVLLPALSHIQANLQRQAQAFLRATGMLATIVVPVCFLEAALAEPILSLLFPAGKWDSAVPLTQVLCIGIAMWVTQGPTASLLKAQGRWVWFAALSVLYAVGFALCIAVAACLSQAGGAIPQLILLIAGRLGLDVLLQPFVGSGRADLVAITVALCTAVYTPTQVYIAIRPAGGRWRDVSRIFLPPVITSAIAIGLGAAIASPFPDTLAGNLAQLAVTVGVGGGIYMGLVRWLRPMVWNELLELVFRFLPIGRARRLQQRLSAEGAIRAEPSPDRDLFTEID